MTQDDGGFLNSQLRSRDRIHSIELINEAVLSQMIPLVAFLVGGTQEMPHQFFRTFGQDGDIFVAKATMKFIHISIKDPVTKSTKAGLEQ